MTTDTTTTNQLTTKDIACLRSSDRIAFVYNRAEGRSYLDAVKDGDGKNPWEQRHAVTVQVRSESYEEGYRVARASCVLYHYSWERRGLGTFLDLLKTGDTVRACLIAGNDNGYTKDAGLHTDYLYLEILRNGGKRRMGFLVEVCVSPATTARLCQMERIPEGEWS
jgi:hypothetical protein